MDRGMVIKIMRVLRVVKSEATTQEWVTRLLQVWCFERASERLAPCGLVTSARRNGRFGGRCALVTPMKYSAMDISDQYFAHKKIQWHHTLVWIQNIWQVHPSEVDDKRKIDLLREIVYKNAESRRGPMTRGSHWNFIGSRYTYSVKKGTAHQWQCHSNVLAWWLFTYPLALAMSKLWVKPMTWWRAGRLQRMQWGWYYNEQFLIWTCKQKPNGQATIHLLSFRGAKIASPSFDSEASFLLPLLVAACFAIQQIMEMADVTAISRGVTSRRKLHFTFIQLSKHRRVIIDKDIHNSQLVITLAEQYRL